jgi:hypothetical protein
MNICIIHYNSYVSFPTKYTHTQNYLSQRNKKGYKAEELLEQALNNLTEEGGEAVCRKQ